MKGYDSQAIPQHRLVSPTTEPKDYTPPYILADTDALSTRRLRNPSLRDDRECCVESMIGVENRLVEIVQHLQSLIRLSLVVDRERRRATLELAVERESLLVVDCLRFDDVFSDLCRLRKQRNHVVCFAFEIQDTERLHRQVTDYELTRFVLVPMAFTFVHVVLQFCF